VALTVYALTEQLHIISLRFIGTSESYSNSKEASGFKNEYGLILKSKKGRLDLKS